MASLPKAPQAFLSPLLLAGAAYLTQTALKASFSNPNLYMDSSSQANSLFIPNGSPSQSIEASESKSLEVFDDYLTFMLLSAIFSLMMMLFVRVKERFASQQIRHFKGKYGQLTSQDANLEMIYQQDLEESFQIKLIKVIQLLIKGALCYTLAFCFFKLAFFCAFTLYTTGKISPQPYSPEFRTLEESQETPAVLSIPQAPEKVSLAMGRVLASFDVEPAIIAISQDEKWAYVSAKNPQLVRIYDTSDFKAPKQVAAVNLGKLHRSRVFLELSSDGTLLIASNYVEVRIVDVKNPRSPQIIGSFDSLMEKSSDSTTFVSMVLSLDNKYLFMAQIGFAILDISNPSNISMLYTSVERVSTGTGNLASISASKDRKLLYLANGKGALEVYNMTNPGNPLLVNQVNFTNSTATSVHLSQYDNLAYIAGISGRGIAIAINVLDVSNPLEIKQVSNFTIQTSKKSDPIIQALSPSETKLYIIQGDLMVVDLISMSEESNSQNLVKNSPLSICFSSSGQYAGVAYHAQIVFIELFTDYPNTKIFTPSNSSIASFVMDRRFDSWAVSHNGTVLFVAFNDYKTSFEIWDIKDPKVPKRIIALNATQLGVNLTAPFLSFKMSPDNQRIYMKWWTRETSILVILDVSGDLKTPVKLKEYAVHLSINFEDFVFSKNEKILCIAPNSTSIILYDLQGPEQKITPLSYHSDLKSNNSDLQFAKNDTVLMIITSNISLYNVSNSSNPIELGSISITEGGSPRILSTTVLEEEDCLLVEWYQTSRKLRVYNLSDILAPKLISELALPQKNFDSNQDILQEFYGPFVYCESQKLGFVGTDGKLLRVDLSDLKYPRISGIVPVATCKECKGTSRFIISADGNVALATNQSGMLKSLKVNNQNLDLYNGSDMNSQIFATDLQIESTLYIPQEKFLLGERYSDNIFLLENVGNQKYQVVQKAKYKILKLYSYDIKVVSAEPTPQTISSSLPDWMKFHEDTLLLTLESKSKKDLGDYTICAAISYKVDKDDLKNIGPENKPFTVNEISTTLVSLGYMDPEFYLTTTFKTRDGFFLPEKYANYTDEMYDIISRYYIEDCTKIEILPSLDVSILRPSNKIQIDTTSSEALKIDITLLPSKNNQNAQFLSKTYGPLIPEIRDQKSRIVLQGSLNDIHTALQNIVINAKNTTSYDGIVSIADGLNYPIVGRRISNISDCFLKNLPPFENPNVSKTFQEQVERVSVATGQYFTIMWEENTFTDKYAEGLHYEIVIDNDGNTGEPKAFPDWLSFSNLALRGTPPEKLTDREISLKFVAKNEFQNVTILFKLKIGISPTFALSLLIKYSPMLLTALGFYIKANMIYNIVAKNRYKHSKEYQVQVGEETSILPILFIEDELKEGQTIMKHLLQYLKKKNRFELMLYFVDEESRILDKSKIIESINQTVSELPVKEKEKLPLYLDGSNFKRKKITQILLNQIAMLQLDSSQEKTTKRIFENMKNQWTDLVEWDPELLFVVNKEKLSEILGKSSLKTEEESLSLLGEYRQQINQDLLQDSLLAHTFSHQSLDARSSMVLIVAHERFKRNKIQVFLKQDLEGSHLNSNSPVDYGLSWKLEDDMFVFSGTPKEKLKGKTLAIQIQNIQWRILKEIWIQEKSAGNGDGNGNSTIELIARSESTLRGKTYEIY